MAQLLGQRAGTTGENSTVIGSNASASMYSTKTTGAVAVGSYSKAYATESQALGYFSEVDAKNDRGVALGHALNQLYRLERKAILLKIAMGMLLLGFLKWVQLQ